IIDTAKRKRFINTGIITSLIIVTGFIGIVLMGNQEIWTSADFGTNRLYTLIALTATVTVLVISGVLLLFFIKNKINKKYLNLMKKKSSLDIYIDNLEEKLNYRNNGFNNILNSYGAADLKELFKIRAALDEKKMKLKELEILKKKAAELRNSVSLHIKRASNLMNKNIDGAKELEREIEKLTEDIDANRSQLKCFVDDLNVKSKNLLTKSLNCKSELMAVNSINHKSKLLAGSFNHENELLVNNLNCELEKLVNNLNRNMEWFIDNAKEERGYLPSSLNQGKKHEITLNSIRETEQNLDACSEKVREEEKALALRLKECETIISTSGYDDELLQKAIEEIEELESEKKKLEDIQFSLSKALDILTEASLEIQKDYMPVLNDRMSYYINEITNGRYKDLRADNKLMLKAEDSESVNIVPVLQLSGGTVDQMYLALRFAMSDLISQKEENLPLIMDEVFAQFDDVRIEESMKLLNEITKNRQVIMFTCKCREVDIAREICKNANIFNLMLQFVQ
ncbi:MAG TPA: hypothetical protein PK733_16470, partial [Clostridiales bacterium]|nr:hypothetical protein [Clostridiales bacterium]